MTPWTAQFGNLRSEAARPPQRDPLPPALALSAGLPRVHCKTLHIGDPVIGSQVAPYDTISRRAGFGLSENFECFVCQFGHSLSFFVTHNLPPSTCGSRTADFKGGSVIGSRII